MSGHVVTPRWNRQTRKIPQGVHSALAVVVSRQINFANNNQSQYYLLSLPATTPNSVALQRVFTAKRKRQAFSQTRQRA